VAFLLVHRLSVFASNLFFWDVTLVDGTVYLGNSVCLIDGHRLGNKMIIPEGTAHIIAAAQFGLRIYI
jgi:hypothetical protein